MKIKFKFLLFFAIAAVAFVSCTDDDTTPDKVEPATSYIINYGGYTTDKSTITSFDKETETVVNGVYSGVNGVAITSNAQHALSFNGKVYFMGNNADEIFWVNGETFEQSDNGISTDIIKPRYGVGSGNYLYVSCWGGKIWNDETLSYIAKINLTSNVVEKKIALPGGPEGLAIVNNKLYAALGYKDSVAVMDLGTEEMSYIETPAVCSYFLKDNNDNLYVTLVSTHSDPSSETGLGYINTSNSQLTTYQMAGISSGYVNVLAANDDFTKIYVVGEGENYGDPGAMTVFDVASKSFEADKFLESVSGLNGVAYYNDKVFVFVSESTTSNGKTMIYNAAGTKESEFETGIAPFMLLTVE